MPHKKANRLTREREKAARGTDLVPKISTDHEPIPKSVSRVLDAGRIRREYRERKRQRDGADEVNPRRKKGRHDAAEMKDETETKALKIKPGETITQFNKRVEDVMKPLMKTALRQSSSQMRKVRKEETHRQPKEGDRTGRRSHPESSKKASDPLPIAPSSDEPSVAPRNVAKEFQALSTSQPRRLNDIAQEPPDIKKLPRGAKKNDGVVSGVLSMAQKAMMEEERAEAIKRYRELKARKLREANGVKVDG